MVFESPHPPPCGQGGGQWSDAAEGFRQPVRGKSLHRRMHIGRKLIFWRVCQERQPVPDPEQRRDVNINLALGRKYQPVFLVENINLVLRYRKYQPGFW